MSQAILPLTSDRSEYAQKLRQETIAVRVHHVKMGVRRALSRDQVRRAAEPFHAEAGALSASKRLIDINHPAYRTVASIRRQATDFWHSMTVPYPEPGVRLLRRDHVEFFDAQMQKYKSSLQEAAARLQESYDDLREQARQALGDLFNPSDYPARIDSEFALSWDYPSIEPPEYLKKVHPELYEAEAKRIRARFEEAVALTEQAFAQRFAELVSHLADRLRGDVDGKPKIFRDSAVGNLKEFFDQFRNLNIGSSGELEELINRAQQAVEGVTPDDLRSNGDIRAQVQAQLGRISQELDGLMVDRPKRAISLEEE